MPTKQKIIYTLPGLGLTPKIYSKLEWGDATVIHLKWIEPLKHEKLSEYVQRLAKQIQYKPDEEELYLVGHSFGGITMQEVAKVVNPKKIILISSIKTVKEKPLTFGFWLNAFPIYKLGGKEAILKSFPSWGPSHGYHDKESQEIFIEAINSLSSYYFKWAIAQVCKWKESQNHPKNIYHIHGTADKTFPFKKIKPEVIQVKGGDHIMLFNDAANIGLLIKSILHLNE